MLRVAVCESYRVRAGAQAETDCVPSRDNFKKFLDTVSVLASGDGVTCSYRGGTFDAGVQYTPRQDLDEALSRVVIDFSGRPGLASRVTYPRARIGAFDVALVSPGLVQTAAAPELQAGRPPLPARCNSRAAPADPRRAVFGLRLEGRSRPAC